MKAARPANAVLFLASDEVNCITGENLMVDDGWMASRCMGINSRRARIVLCAVRAKGDSPLDRILERGPQMNAVITVIYDWSRIVAGWLAWAAPLAGRITVGVVFIGTGWTKLHHLPPIIQNFTALGIPAPEILTP